MHRFRHPEAHRGRLGSRPGPRHHFAHHLGWGGAWIAAGIIVLLQQQGTLTHHELWLIAPAALAWTALVRVALDRTAYGAAAALARGVTAAYLYVVIEQIGGWTFAATWPVLLIAVGLSTIAHALMYRGRDEGTPPGSQEPSW